VSSFLRKMAELKEPQGWVHHAAEAVTGNLLTTQLDRPVTLLLRAEKLSQLGINSIHRSSGRRHTGLRRDTRTSPRHRVSSILRGRALRPPTTMIPMVVRIGFCRTLFPHGPDAWTLCSWTRPRVAAY
jgi:hypothetical protein